MITGISATDRIFSILNVQAVKSLLNGAIYKEEPLNEQVYQKRNISLFPLTTSMDFLNEHVVNVNIFCPDLPTGQTDGTTLNSIAQAVINTLKAYRSESDYFHLTILSSGLIKDESNRSYVNIRIEIVTE